MRSYHKLWIRDDETLVSRTDNSPGMVTSDGIGPNLVAMKNFKIDRMIQAYNFIANVNPDPNNNPFGPKWAIIDFGGVFNARIISSFDGPGLASNIFDRIPYGEHPEN